MIYAFFPLMAAAFFGLAYAFMPKAMQHVSVATYVLIESFFVFILVFPLVFIKKEAISFEFLSDGKSAIIAVIFAALAPALGWFFTLYAIKNTSAAYTAFAEISYPLFVILFLFIFFGVRNFDWSIVLGGVLVMLGSFVLVYGQMKAS